MDAGPRLLGLVIGLVGFSILHSVFAVPRIRIQVSQALGLGPQAYRLAYSILALVIFVPTLVLAFRPSPLVWSAEGWLRVVLWAVQILAAGGSLWALASIQVGAFVGVQGEPAGPEGQMLRTNGIYALCRHPLYFFMALLATSAPGMHQGRLILAIWFWTYGLLGSVFEERRLLTDFGDVYRRYQRTHHRILPLGPKRATADVPR